ncbi:hypothetical protein K458DRAFT_460896 [Lentithecium fluviatile CBS 122367]|uniref:Methyltransferase type 11 domain-containing protein n=1 Tax=Lentithecium fluviatile CBS 122367 TaxID=1168545 RepID=A0A6G1IN33_9PLEO|nr:hypothetical protein K458DRAFT_460896 [Lentithecium fluviatile CBS 122367]
MPTHEWLRDFASLDLFPSKHIFSGRTPQSRPLILHIGSGDSTIPYELIKRGYINQICLDFPPLLYPVPAVVGVIWELGDVQKMLAFPDRSIDIGLSKSTLDVIIRGSP